MTTNKIIIDKQTGTILTYDHCVVVDLDKLDGISQLLWSEWNSSGNDNDAITLGEYAGQDLDGDKQR